MSGKSYRRASAKVTTPTRKRAASPDQESGMTPEMMLDTVVDFLKRRGLPAVFLGLLAGGTLSFIAYTMLPVTYTAVASVTIRAPKDTFAERFKQTQMDLITSPRVLNAALNDPKAKALPFVQKSNQPAQELAKQIKFVSDANSEMVEVTMTGVDAEELQILVNAVVEAYLEQTNELTNVHAANEERLYSQRIEEAKQSISSLRLRQERLAQEVGETDPNAAKVQLDAIRTVIADKKKQRDDIVLRKLTLESELERLRKSPPRLTLEQENSLRSMRTEQSVREDSALDVMQAKADAIRNSSTLGNRDSEYIQRQQYIDLRRAKLAEETEGILKKALERLAEKREEDIDLKRREVDVANQTIRSLDADRLADEAREKQLQKVAAEIALLQQEVAKIEETQQRYADSLKEVSLARDSKYISLVGLAELPKLATSSKKRLAAVAGGGLGGFGTVVLLFWFFDFRRKLISRPEHLHRQLTLPVLGVLPTIPPGARLPTDEDFSSDSKNQKQWIAMQEAINALRITLTFAPDRHEDGLTSLMITSPRDGEGKSTLTAQLAVSLARSGVRVIIVEADMHRPTQFDTFGIDRAPGLSDVLQQTIDVKEAIKETRYPGLDILTAGTAVADLTAMLVSERVRPVFEYLSTAYDTVLVDAPPTLPVYDAMLFGRLVDQTILCAKCNHSQLYALEQAQHRLESIDIPIMGVVVSAAPPVPKYYYSYYRGEKYGSYAGRSNLNPPNDPTPPVSNNGASNKTAARL